MALSSIPPGRTAGPGLAVGTAVFTAAFLYLLPEASDLTDDHFMHVAWGRQLLYGHWFIRDMETMGLPLQSALSAAFEWGIGHRLLSEGLNIALAYAAGAVLTFVLAHRASGSMWIAVPAAAFQVALSPRTYSYPKIVLYAAALLALWRYIDSPSNRRAAVAAMVVGVGFYLRHDHGLYLAIIAAGVVALRHARDGGSLVIRRLAAFASICGLMVAPYLLYAQFNGGVVAYASNLRALAEREHSQNHFDGWPEWPLTSFDDVIGLPARPPNATIGVRWDDDATNDERRAAAARYGLHVDEDAPVESGRFLVNDISPRNILALIADPIVDDTSDVDRKTGKVPLQGVRLGDLHALPGLDAPVASAAFLYYLFLGLLLATAVALVRMQDPAIRMERLKIAAVLLVGIATAIGFLREPLAIRIADAVVAPVVLAAWWAGRTLRNPVGRAGSRWAAALIAVALLIPVARSTVVLGAVPSRAQRLRHVPQIWEQLAVSPPFEAWQAKGGAKYQAVRYVRACTSPAEPLLVLWFAPDIYYYSGRPFAGRLSFYLEGYWTSADQERANIAAIERARPAVALMEAGRAATDLYTYPRLLAYVSSAYREVGALHPSEGPAIAVYVRNDRNPAGVDIQTGLPCFTSGPSNDARPRDDDTGG